MFRQLYPVAIKPSVYKSVSQKKNLLVLDWNQFKYDYKYKCKCKYKFQKKLAPPPPKLQSALPSRTFP